MDAPAPSLNDLISAQSVEEQAAHAQHQVAPSLIPPATPFRAPSFLQQGILQTLP